MNTENVEFWISNLKHNENLKQTFDDCLYDGEGYSPLGVANLLFGCGEYVEQERGWSYTEKGKDYDDGISAFALEQLDLEDDTTDIEVELANGDTDVVTVDFLSAELGLEFAQIADILEIAYLDREVVPFEEMIKR